MNDDCAGNTLSVQFARTAVAAELPCSGYNLSSVAVCHA